MKQLLPHLQKRLSQNQESPSKRFNSKSLMCVNSPQEEFVPHSFKSYKSHFPEKYENLGGLGKVSELRIGANIESHEWKSAMNKKKRMNAISKSIDCMNKKKVFSHFHHLACRICSEWPVEGNLKGNHIGVDVVCSQYSRTKPQDITDMQSGGNQSINGIQVG